MMVSVWFNFPVLWRNYDFRAVTTQLGKGIPMGKSMQLLYIQERGQ